MMDRMTDWKRKTILIRTRNWSGLYEFEEYRHYRKKIKTEFKGKTLKIMG